MQANGFLDKWRLASENVLAVLLAEERATDSVVGYERAVYEYGLDPIHMPPGYHRAALQTIMDLRDRREPVHASTVGTNAVGNVPETWLYQIQATYDITIDGTVFDHNVRALKEFGETARIQRAIAGAGEALSQGEKRDEVVSNLMTELANTGTDIIRDETAGAAGAAFEQMMNENPTKTMKTGIAPLDGWMGGIGTDDVIGIVAPYKMRKSTVKRNVVLNIVEAGGSADVCMFESNRTMVNAQFVSMLAIRWLHKTNQYDAKDKRGNPIRWISAKDLVRVRAGYRQWDALKVEAVNQGIKQFKALGERLRVYDKSKDGGGLNDLGSLQRVLLRSKKRYGTDIAAVDHLLLISEPGTDYEVMSKASRFLETFARREKVSLLLLAQMNEASIRENGTGHSPGVKGGGDLAASVDYMFTVAYKEQAEGSIGKNDVMTICMRLSRYGEGGANVTADLRIDPTSGWILGVAG
jgi:hypothetical protein